MPRVVRSRKPKRPQNEEVALISIDSRPLQAAAWRKLALARKRLGRVTSDLHRHEQVDVPAYEAWTLSCGAALISELRDLALQCQTKTALIAEVERHAWLQGRPPALVWQHYKRTGEFGDPVEVEDAGGREAEEDDLLEDMAQAFFDGDDLEDFDDDPRVRDLGRPSFTTPDEAEAKEIYRRLVQRLHPDRGGTWSRHRQELWHQVQRAWEARDAGWLARLEAEFELETDVLTVESPLGRLYTAIREIDAARRATERKLRGFRHTPAWQFTKRPPTPEDRRALRAALLDHREQLLAALAHLEATLSRWERPVGQARAKQPARPRRRRGTEEALPLR